MQCAMYINTEGSIIKNSVYKSMSVVLWYFTIYTFRDFLQFIKKKKLFFYLLFYILLLVLLLLLWNLEQGRNIGRKFIFIFCNFLEKYCLLIDFLFLFF